ncbi:MAG: ExbD/TolR family protein, partial [Phycisphaerales bacterium JB063]
MADENDIMPPDADEEVQVVHHTSQRKKRRVNDGEMELQLTSMIDVIFQLLIYFVITANFTIDEGTLDRK